MPEKGLWGMHGSRDESSGMKRKRLLWQLFPSYLLITLIALAAVSGFASRTLRQFFLDHIAEDLHARARLIEPLVVEHLSPLQRHALEQVCKKVGETSGTRITVVLPSGRVAGDSQESPAQMDNHGNRPEILQAAEAGHGMSVRKSATLDKDMMYVAVAVRQPDGLAAYVRTSLPLTDIDARIRSIQIRLILVGIVVAVLAAILSLLVSRRITRPVEQMRQGAERFAEGSLAHRLPMPGSEELAALAATLNRMATQLDSRIQTISRQRSELETVLSSMSEAVVAVDMDERIISMNPAAVALFGAGAAEKQGRPIQEVVRNPELQRFVENALAGEHPQDGDIRLYHGAERILWTHTTPLRGASDRQVGVLLVMNDVTELRRLESLRKDFVANVSHEIKTPLTAIKGFVETLEQGGMEDPDEAKRFLSIISRHVDRLSAIVEDLLKLSRIEREDEAKKFRLTEALLEPILRSAAALFQDRADAKQVRIEVACEPDLRAAVESSLIEQAVVNLLDNAVKYTGEKGKIRVDAAAEDDTVRIRVADDGIGIAKEHLPRLFERFYRVDKARSRNLGGTGLGLSIVKHIAQAHGGTVTVESTPNRGSTFQIHLPR